MRLEMSEKRLSQELLAAQQTRALLQQARQQNLQVKKLHDINPGELNCKKG